MVNQVSLDINSMVVSIHRKLQRHGVVVNSVESSNQSPSSFEARVELKT